MRNYIDSFADDFVNSPEFSALPEETVNTILENFGQYMRGSYRFWKDKDFKPSNEARRDAIVYEYEILRAKSIGELVKLSGLTRVRLTISLSFSTTRHLPKLQNLLTIILLRLKKFEMEVTSKSLV
jgi:hypothetical protein